MTILATRTMTAMTGMIIKCDALVSSDLFVSCLELGGWRT
jgi:hypothetical protein